MMAADHGENSRYMKHLNDGETPCDPCKAGHNRYQRERRASSPAARRANQRYRKALQILRDRHYPEYLVIMFNLKESDDAQPQ